MKNLLILALLFIGSNAFAQSGDIYRDLYNAVDKDHLVTYLRNMSNERYSAQGKRNFRAYWTGFFQSLGIPVRELTYKTRHTKIEAEGHNLEAVLPGRTKDSIVIIVHYDSMGPSYHETENPGVDDDMTGMAMMLETARLLAAVRGRTHYTVRFVAADFEEWAFPGLEGARVYSRMIANQAKQEGFKIVASIDNEQSGWSGASNQIVDVFSCTRSNGFGGRNLPDSNFLGDLFADTVQRYSQLKVQRGCMGENSDFYAMLEVGVPSVVFSEHSPFSNPHFDQEGGDLFERIDLDYFFRISQVAVTFAGRVVGIENPFMTRLSQR